MPEINPHDIKGVVRGYHKEAGITKGVGELLGHKVKDKTRKPTEFFKHIAHRIKYALSKEYKQFFNEKAAEYLKGIVAPSEPEDKSVESSEDNSKLERHAARQAKKAQAKALEKRVKKGRSKLADKIVELEKAKGIVEAKREAIQMLGQEIALLKSVGSAERARLEKELQNEIMPEWGEKIGRKLGGKKLGVKWDPKSVYTLGKEGDALTKIQTIEDEIAKKRLGGHRKQDHRKKIDILKPKLEQLRDLNAKLPEELRGTPTAELKKRVIELDSALEEGMKDLRDFNSDIQKLEGEARVMREAIGQLEAELEGLGGARRKHHKHKDETEEAPVEQVEEINEVEEIEEVEEEPIEFNEYTQKFFDMLEAKFKDEPNVKRLWVTHLGFFVNNMGVDCCTGFSEKNGKYSLTFDRPLQFYVENGNIILRLEKEVEFRLEGSTFLFRKGYESIADISDLKSGLTGAQAKIAKMLPTVIGISIQKAVIEGNTIKIKTTLPEAVSPAEEFDFDELEQDIKNAEVVDSGLDPKKFLKSRIK